VDAGALVSDASTRLAKATPNTVAAAAAKAIRLNMKVLVGFYPRTFAVADWRARNKFGRILSMRPLSDVGFS
jgi:hypothetical protein